MPRCATIIRRLVTMPPPAAAQPSPPEDPLLAGAARVVITPPLGSSMSGGWHDRRATGVDDDLHAHAIVLRRGQTTLALVSCDVICLPKDVCGAARDRIARRVGIPGDHVLIAATHTHTGPSVCHLLGVDRDDAYTDALPARIADSVELAIQHLQPAALASATAHESRVSFNRRYWLRDGTVRMNPGYANPDVLRPAGPIDPEIGIVHITTASGAPLAAVLSFALHFVGTDDQYAYSADYFGHVGRLFQRVYGPDFGTVFFNGASGDINRIDVTAPPFRAGHHYAEQVARAIVGGVLRETALLKPDPAPPLGAARARLPYHPKAMSAADVELARRILAAPSDTPLTETPFTPGPFSWVVGHPIPQNLWTLYARETVRVSQLAPDLETEVQAVRLGDAALVALPGEVFCALGLDIKSRSPFRPTLIAELANDYLGYVPTADAIEREGGYETWAALSALPAAGTGEALVDAAVDLLGCLRQSSQPARY